MKIIFLKSIFKVFINFSSCLQTIYIGYWLFIVQSSARIIPRNKKDGFSPYLSVIF